LSVVVHSNLLVVMALNDSGAPAVDRQLRASIAGGDAPCPRAVAPRGGGRDGGDAAVRDDAGDETDHEARSASRTWTRSAWPRVRTRRRLRCTSPTKIEGIDIADPCTMEIRDLAGWVRGLDERPSCRCSRRWGRPSTLFEEPTIGLHPHDVQRMSDLLLRAGGTITGHHLDDRARLKDTVRTATGTLEIRGAATYNLRDVDPRGAQPADAPRRSPPVGRVPSREATRSRRSRTAFRSAGGSRRRSAGRCASRGRPPGGSRR
jgi:hypothetical protein